MADPPNRGDANAQRADSGKKSKHNNINTSWANAARNNISTLPLMRKSGGGSTINIKMNQSELESFLIPIDLSNAGNEAGKPLGKSQSFRFILVKVNEDDTMSKFDIAIGQKGRDYFPSLCRIVRKSLDKITAKAYESRVESSGADSIPTCTFQVVNGHMAITVSVSDKVVADFIESKSMEGLTVPIRETEEAEDKYYLVSEPVKKKTHRVTLQMGIWNESVCLTTEIYKCALKKIREIFKISSDGQLEFEAVVENNGKDGGLARQMKNIVVSIPITEDNKNVWHQGSWRKVTLPNGKYFRIRSASPPIPTLKDMSLVDHAVVDTQHWTNISYMHNAKVVAESMTEVASPEMEKEKVVAPEGVDTVNFPPLPQSDGSNGSPNGSSRSQDSTKVIRGPGHMANTGSAGSISTSDSSSSNDNMSSSGGDTTSLASLATAQSVKSVDESTDDKGVSGVSGSVVTTKNALLVTPMSEDKEMEEGEISPSGQATKKSKNNDMSASVSGVGPSNSSCTGTDICNQCSKGKRCNLCKTRDNTQKLLKERPPQTSLSGNGSRRRSLSSNHHMSVSE